MTSRYANTESDGHECHPHPCPKYYERATIDDDSSGITESVERPLDVASLDACQDIATE